MMGSCDVRATSLSLGVMQADPPQRLVTSTLAPSLMVRNNFASNFNESSSMILTNHDPAGTFVHHLKSTDGGQHTVN
jgi:hypothetical protein